MTQNINQQGGSGGNLVNGTVALWLTVLAAPPIFDLTAPYVHRILVNHYGHEMADLGMFGHAVAVAALTFAGMNRSVAVVTVLLTTALGRVGWRLAAF